MENSTMGEVLMNIWSVGLIALTIYGFIVFTYFAVMDIRDRRRKRRQDVH